MLLNSHTSAYARCLAGKVCGIVQSTWGTSLGEDKLGARDKILNTKVARWACTGRAPGKHSPQNLTAVDMGMPVVQKERWVKWWTSTLVIAPASNSVVPASVFVPQTCTATQHAKVVLSLPDFLSYIHHNSLHSHENTILWEKM